MADLTLTTAQQATLTAEANTPAPVGEQIPVPQPFSWTTSDPTIINLQFPGGGVNSALAVAGVVGTATVTVTSGSLSQTFVIDVVADDPVGITVVPSFVQLQNPPGGSGQRRGFGLGLGYN